MGTRLVRSTRRSNTVPMAARTVPRPRGAGSATPTSRSSEVTPRSSIPHGTINRKNSRSVLTLKAKPWLVTQREMRTPMAPIFSAGPELLARPSGFAGSVGLVVDPHPGAREAGNASGGDAVARRTPGSSPLPGRARSGARRGDRDRGRRSDTRRSARDRGRSRRRRGRSRGPRRRGPAARRRWRGCATARRRPSRPSVSTCGCCSSSRVSGIAPALRCSTSSRCSASASP